ncbi:MAG: hypothetical protein K2O03_14230, partial [Lachnospiraceae bacterium]|nr:hypothetical protein [Lachnospiraceae bacterium]
IWFWRYEKAGEQLKCFYELCKKEKGFPMRVCYQLFAFLKIRQKQGTKEDRKLFQAFMEQEMPDFETRLLANKPYSLEELSLITVYYGLVEEDTAKRLKKLYCVAHCLREEFVQEEERLRSFYAELMLACAQCQYELGDYVNCIAQCEEGIKVTSRFRICVAGGELYECMADAKGKLLEEEMRRNESKEQWFVMGGEERKKRMEAVLKDYMIADALYDSFYFGYRDGYKDICNRKAERWKSMMQEK